MRVSLSDLGGVYLQKVLDLKAQMLLTAEPRKKGEPEIPFCEFPVIFDPKFPRLDGANGPALWLTVS